MKHPELLRAGVLALATIAAGSAFAQRTGPNTTTPATPVLSTPVVSDAAPAPPEDRASPGAIVLQDSPVRAQREAAATHSMGAGPSFESITRRARRAKAAAELESTRMDRQPSARPHGEAQE